MSVIGYQLSARSDGTLGQGEDALVAAGQGDWLGPGEIGAGCGTDPGQFGLRGEGCEPAVRSDEAGRGSDGFFHAIDGAEGHAIVGAGQGLGAGGMDAGGDAGDADGFLEEGGFFVLGFGEGDGDFGAADGDGNAGEAGAGSIVEEGGDAGGKGMGAGDGLEEVALEDGVGIADGGEVGAGVPVNEERQIVYKLFIFYYLQ